jgi:hypothetical protein
MRVRYDRPSRRPSGWARTRRSSAANAVGISIGAEIAQTHQPVLECRQVASGSEFALSLGHDHESQRKRLVFSPGGWLVRAPIAYLDATGLLLDMIGRNTDRLTCRSSRMPPAQGDRVNDLGMKSDHQGRENAALSGQWA